MNSIQSLIIQGNDILNRFVWGPFMLSAFLGIGILFTVRTKFFQFINFSFWMKSTIFKIFKHDKKNVLHTKDQHSISQFQSLCTALAATIGTGNIAGVATAITAGGPGAVFWMWISAFLGMMTNYAEIVLGIKYRYRDSSGKWVGGAMVYIERGLHSRPLAISFCLFCILASFGIGNMTQANSIACGLKDSFCIPPQITGLTLMVFLSFVILGGIRRVAGVAEKLVPFMGISYLIGGIWILAVNYAQIPDTLFLIMQEAFAKRSIGGGIAGYGISIAMQKGISRGIFSNEAGLGSSVMAHTAAEVDSPCQQGMWGIFQVFTDTIVICTLTALVILTSKVPYGKDAESGVAMTGAAFETLFPFGKEFICLIVVLFAFATLLGWSYYGEKAATYLFGEKAVFPYKVLFLLAVYPGCTASLNLVWSISDTFNGLMAIPNLIALYLLSGEVIKEHQKWKSRGNSL